MVALYSCFLPSSIYLSLSTLSSFHASLYFLLLLPLYSLLPLPTTLPSTPSFLTFLPSLYPPTLLPPASCSTLYPNHY